MTNELLGDVVWLKASAYLVEESRTPLEDGATYFTMPALIFAQVSLDGEQSSK
ncbi:hypothetical protein PCANC_27305 [Puccinia coronata f. sp. avenae]|uniref:Uncharacterized protein n=1 Tax=Puccinia coronata f. sp. avenae TaxID=200324 RepID=A0A2N5SC18_9BASI|nr:hypothetical protein PCANC_27305 [Puccinia coronata f. sp. avenae]